jgi:hypothetical protein
MPIKRAIGLAVFSHLMTRLCVKWSSNEYPNHRTLRSSATVSPRDHRQLSGRNQG